MSAECLAPRGELRRRTGETEHRRIGGRRQGDKEMLRHGDGEDSWQQAAGRKHGETGTRR